MSTFNRARSIGTQQAAMGEGRAREVLSAKMEKTRVGWRHVVTSVM